jgi:hypothetical protein
MDDNQRVINKLDKIEDKMDSRLAAMESRLTDMAVHMAIYNAELTKHIEGVALARKENADIRAKYDKEVPALQRFNERASWTIVVIASLGAIISWLTNLKLSL